MKPDGSPKQLRFLYPWFGILLSLGAPIGHLSLQLFLSKHPLTAEWLRWEIEGHPATYLYLLLSTAIVFGVLAFFLGAKEDILRELATRDPLTNLFNRRFFQERLREEMTRFSRYTVPVSLMILDIDHLKTLNDTLGHGAGDEAIRAVAEILECKLRATDVVARYGGDEYTAVLPHTKIDEALVIAERVRQSVRDHRIEGTRLSVSVGLAAPTGGLACPENLIAAADDALLNAKASGRNRISVAPNSTLGTYQRQSARSRMSKTLSRSQRRDIKNRFPTALRLECHRDR